jgi:hypothetical protein
LWRNPVSASAIKKRGLKGINLQALSKLSVEI